MVVNRFNRQLSILILAAFSAGCVSKNQQFGEREREQPELSSQNRILVLVPTLTGPQQCITIWETRLDQPLVNVFPNDPPGEISLERTWRHFASSGGLQLELLPHLREVGPLSEKAFGSRHDSFGVFGQLRFPLPSPGQMKDVRLLQGYLRTCSVFYEKNICVECPVPPRFYPGAVRNEPVASLFLRDLPEDTIREAHRTFLLKNLEMLSWQPPKSPEQMDIQELWREYIQQFNHRGCEMTLIEVDIPANIVVVRGMADTARRISELYHWL